ncbi:MAG: hydrogenase nickel incorporation protein HypB [Chloroflexi bacterium]|nr:hydrogenase nickel incorporation protein HypB [Chloroflexota bacterium]
MPKDIPVIEQILSANDQIAEQNRERLAKNRVHTINIMAAPGAGKTSLILSAIRGLRGIRRIGVIEGDVASDVDSVKIRQEGIPVVQINTGGGCHLDASQIRVALDQLPLNEIDLLFIENVGNLICPVGFDLGEQTRLAITSIPEGDDKPYKYPSIFHEVDALVISKIDLLPYIPFNIVEYRRLVRSIKPEIQLFEVSVVTGDGLAEWLEWLKTLSPRT